MFGETWWAVLGLVISQFTNPGPPAFSNIWHNNGGCEVHVPWEVCQQQLPLAVPQVMFGAFGGLGFLGSPYEDCYFGVSWESQTKLKPPIYHLIINCLFFPHVFCQLRVNCWFGALVVWDSNRVPLRIPIPFIFGESQESKPPGPNPNQQLHPRNST